MRELMPTCGSACILVILIVLSSTATVTTTAATTVAGSAVKQTFNKAASSLSAQQSRRRPPALPCEHVNSSSSYEIDPRGCGRVWWGPCGETTGRLLSCFVAPVGGGCCGGTGQTAKRTGSTCPQSDHQRRFSKDTALKPSAQHGGGCAQAVSCCSVLISQFPYCTRAKMRCCW